jgi:hypothetical protein
MCREDTEQCAEGAGDRNGEHDPEEAVSAWAVLRGCAHDKNVSDYAAGALVAVVLDVAVVDAARS